MPTYPVSLGRSCKVRHRIAPSCFLKSEPSPITQVLFHASYLVIALTCSTKTLRFHSLNMYRHTTTQPHSHAFPFTHSHIHNNVLTRSQCCDIRRCPVHDDLRGSPAWCLANIPSCMQDDGAAVGPFAGAHEPRRGSRTHVCSSSCIFEHVASPWGMGVPVTRHMIYLLRSIVVGLAVVAIVRYLLSLPTLFPDLFGKPVLLCLPTTFDGC